MKLILTTVAIASVITAAGVPPLRDANCWSSERERLTVEYNRQHYGLDTARLEHPQMIVIHYTVTKDIKRTLDYFAPAELENGRTEIMHGGRLNVGVHFIVDRDGTVYSSVPEEYCGRHTIGFNHVAFGIENVAMNAKELTKAQLAANARLCAYLAEKYPSVKYLIGHDEHMDTKLPHYALVMELDPAYRFHVKYDPGPRFMKDLRAVLVKKYGIKLER